MAPAAFQWITQPLEDLQTSTSCTSRLAIIVLYCVCISTWIQSVVSTKQLGLPRFLATLPVVLGNCLLPLLFSAKDDVCLRVGIAFCFVWLCNAKVLGFAAGRGPLCMPLTALQFGVVLIVPVTPRLDSSKGESIPRVGSRGSLGLSGGSPSQLLGSFLAKTLCLCFVVFLATGVELPRLVMEIVYALGLFAFLGFIMDGPATLATSLIGLPISPHFDQPYLAPSLASFWSRRWNLTASNTLRFLVYDIITEGSIVGVAREKPAAPSKLRRVGAMMSSFVVSGLIHEVMLWYVLHTTDGRWLAFFSLQGPMVLVESLLRGVALQSGLKLPQPLAIATTVTVLMASADWLFFPPCLDSGLSDRVVLSIKESFQAAAKLVS